MSKVNLNSKVMEQKSGKKTVQFSANVNHKLGTPFKKYIHDSGQSFTYILEKHIENILNENGVPHD